MLSEADAQGTLWEDDQLLKESEDQLDEYMHFPSTRKRCLPVLSCIEDLSWPIMYALCSVLKSGVMQCWCRAEVAVFV